MKRGQDEDLFGFAWLSLKSQRILYLYTDTTLPFTVQYWTELVISIYSINKITLRIYSSWDQEILHQEILHLCSCICIIISFSILCWPLCRGEHEYFVKTAILNGNGNLANHSKKISVGGCALQLSFCQLQNSLWSIELSTMCLILL